MEHIYIKDIEKATGGRILCGNPDQLIENLAIDSRSMNGCDLFVPLIGEKVDAHRFIEQAFSNGAVATLTSEHDTMEDSHAWIRVEDTKKALQDIGRFIRSRINLPLVGVTGSVGKTTTREMIATALSAGYQVFKTPNNQNSQIGVPITLSKINSSYNAGVIELGMSEPGELTVIAEMAEIDMAVITNIGIAHIEQLGSRENILKEKLTIQNGLKKGGILFLNGDDELLKTVDVKDGIKAITYGTSSDCDYYAENIREVKGCPVFDFVHGKERYRVALNVIGRHNILNACVALAVADCMKVPVQQAAEALLTFHGFKGRQQILKCKDITIIDDTYNASPVSMMAGIDILNAIMKEETQGRKIAVLADMKELGEDTVRFHQEVGEHIVKNPVDVLVTLGELAKEIAVPVRKSCNIVVKSFTDMEELLDYLTQEIRKDDCILFKGSNSMRLGQAVEYFLDQYEER